MDESFIQEIERMHVRGIQPITVEKDGVPYVMVPNDHSIRSMEEYLPKPTRIRANRRFISLESFNRYVNEFKNDDTRIEVSAGGNAQAFIDASGKDAPEWEHHIAAFSVTWSDRWNTWMKMNRQSLGQRQFAEFAEENTADFFMPQGGLMLDIARTLQAEQNSTFSGGIRLENGDVQFGYTKTTKAKAGEKSDIEIPSQFTISVPILENETPRQIPIRLRYELNEGKLTFTYEIIRKDALLQEVRRSIYAVIANETEIEPLLVA